MNLDELSAWGMDLETELRRERRIELAGEAIGIGVSLPELGYAYALYCEW